MSIPDEVETRILDKAAYIEEAVTVLSRKQDLDESTYRNSREQRAIVEREFQTAIEACIDIASLLLSASGESVPKTNAERFEELENAGILSTETSEHLQSAAGFRNVLSHTYGDEIDNTVVYQHLQNELGWFVAFLREVRAFLDTSEKE